MQFAREVEKAHKAMLAEHSAKGILQSSATVKVALEITETKASKYIEDVIDLVAEVAKDTEASSLIVAHLTATFRTLEVHVAKAVRLACGGQDSDRSPNIKSSSDKLFAEVSDNAFRQLEIHRFTFTKPSRGDLRNIGFGSRSEIASDRLTKNKGGKPLAKHWDGMWAHIAVQLWVGDLKPETQADLKAAMLDWFNEASIEIGDTAVTQRARQLWEAMQATDG